MAVHVSGPRGRHPKRPVVERLTDMKTKRKYLWDEKHQKHAAVMRRRNAKLAKAKKSEKLRNYWLLRRICAAA